MTYFSETGPDWSLMGKSLACGQRLGEGLGRGELVALVQFRVSFDI